jgi:rhodanese-related sulfurtransferase
MLYTNPLFQTYQVEGIKHIAATDVVNWFGTAGIFLDIREYSEHVTGIPAINVRFMKTPLTSFLSFLDAIPKEEKIVVMCTHGIRSSQLTHWLNSNGWKMAVNLDGGFESYQLSGLPVTY